MKAAAQVSIWSNAERGMPLLAIAASSAGTLRRRDARRRSAAGRCEKPSLVSIADQLLRVLVVDDGLDAPARCEPATAWSNVGRAPAVFLGQQVDGAEQIDGRVGVRDAPQRRSAPCASAAWGRQRERQPRQRTRRAIRRNISFSILILSLPFGVTSMLEARKPEPSTCPPTIASAKARPRCRRGPPLEPELPGPDPDAPPILGRAGLRDPPALRHGDGGGDLPPGDRAARARARAVEGGLRPAVPPPDRRPLRREPQPARPLLPVSGGAEAEPGRPPGPLSRQPRARSASTR